MIPTDELPVYIPQPGCLTNIIKGSGIVGRPFDQLHTKIYFEGNKFKYSNVHSIEDKIRIAADRLVTSYPTVATMVVPNHELVEVGLYNRHNHEFVPYDDKKVEIETWEST